jgi:hypothetical protein
MLFWMIRDVANDGTFTSHCTYTAQFFFLIQFIDLPAERQGFQMTSSYLKQQFKQTIPPQIHSYTSNNDFTEYVSCQ